MLSHRPTLGMRGTSRFQQPLWRFLHFAIILSLLIVGLLPPPAALALTASQIQIRMMTDPLLVSDSNGCSNGDGPQATYVGFKVTNTSGTTLTNLSVNLSGFVTGFSLAGGQAATQYIGTLAAGESDIVYWYITYPCHTAAIHQDTLTVTVSDGGQTAAYAYSNSSALDPATTENITTTIQSIDTISANAGGLYQASTLGPGAVIGQIIPYDVTYSFGGVAIGDRYNLQPSGEANFNAGCFQLINAEILSSQATAITAGTTDDLFYYAAAKQSGSGYDVTVRYYFLYLCDGVTTSALPYASQTSGSTNVKYAESGYTAANAISFPPATNAFQVSKRASPAVLPNGGTVTYTVLITNTSTYNSSLTSITDVLPTGVSYAALQSSSSFEIINRSSIQPVSGATGTIQWQGGKPSTFPYDSYYVPAGTALKLVYTANVSSTAGSYTNTVSPYVGTKAVGSATSTVSVGNADLAVTKTASTLTPNLGSNVTFTIQVTNNGPSTATNAVVNDVLPSGLSFVSANPAVEYNPTTGAWAVGSLASGASKTLSVVATVTQASAITNSATVSSSITDLTPANNTSSVTVTGQQADLQVSKSVDKVNAAVGTQVVFTIQVHNNGASNTSGVVINDLLPAGLGYVSSSASQGGYNNASGAWAVGSLANGATASLTITATVNQAGAITNTASVAASDRPDPNSANNSSSAGINGQQADLALTKTVSNPTPNVGTNVSFTLQVTNNGPSRATNVVINDSLPTGLSFVSATPTAAYNSTNGNWTIASLASGASATLTIVATVTQPGTITNGVLVTAADQQDPVSTNNTASVTVTGQQADLVLSKTASNATPNVNTDVTFTLQVTNSGPGIATNVVVNDVLPIGLSFVSASPTADYNSATGVWTVGTLSSGASTTLTIVATVTQAGALTNTAGASAAQTDPTPANNTSSAVVTGQQADLSISKSVDNSSPNVGDQAIFTIALSNQGPSTANNISVNEILPSGLSLVSASPSQGTYNAVSGIWALPALGSGSNATLTIVTTVLTAGPKTNTVSVSSSQPDPDPSDNMSSVIVTGQQVDLAVDKTVSDATPNVGSNVTFTIKVTNNGPSMATGVSLSDVLPSGLSFVSATSSEGSYDNLAGIWSGISLNNTEFATLQIVAIVTGDAAVTNIASISAVDQPDLNASNDSGSVSVTGQQADLVVTKSIDNPTPNVGSNVTFTIEVTNNGPSTASNVVVNDALPVGLGLISVTPSGAYNSTTGDWAVGTLANGAKATLTIVAIVNASSGITNIAQIKSSDLPDPNNTNNTGSSSLNGQQADLVLSKTVSNATPNVGSNVSFTVQVTNNGPSTATNILVNDPLPAGLSFVSANPPAAYNSTTGVWAVGTLANTASATLTIVATVTQPGGITNSATATADQPDPSSINNTASATVTGQEADLVVTKTVNNATPNVGTNVTFTIQVINTGPSTANNVVVNDVLPSGLTFVSATPAAAYNSTTGNWTVGTLANTASATLTIVATVEQAGAITNTASVSSDQPDPDPADSSSAATLTGQQADLSIHKTVDQPATSVGSNVTFTLLVTNNGPSEATNVLVSDALPSGLVYVSSVVGQGSYNDITGGWAVGTLASTANATLTIVARVDQVGNVLNTASVTSAQPDPNTGNNSSSVTVTGQQADLALTKVVDDTTPNVGSDASFTLIVTNTGPDDVSNVSVVDLLPAGLSFVSANPSADYISSTGVWNVGTLANGASKSLTIVATLTLPGTITNNAHITGSSLPDPDATNDTAIATVTGQQADLSIVKSVSKANPNLNETITYAIQVSNNGPGDATGVVVTDSLPAGLEYVSHTASPNTYNQATGIWSIGNLGAGTSASLSIQVIVRQVVPPITNTASITASDQPDPNNGNNSSSVTIPSASADLEIAKSVGNSVPNVGTEVTFIVTVTNKGPDAASNVTINDLLPAGLSYVSDSSSQGSYDDATGLWAVGALALNEQASLSIVATVVTPGVVLTNVAQLIGLDQVDTNLSNNRATATVTGQQADLSVTKTVNTASVNVGENVIFTVQVTNNGPSTATGVALGDVLPAGLSFVSASSSPVSSYTGGVWSIGSLVNGAAATLTIEATVTQAARLTNNAAITASDQPDPTPSNNSDSVDVTGLAADLVLEKGVSSPTANVGSDVTFTITVRNTGPHDASNVVVTDVLPAGLSFVSMTTAQGSYNNGTGAWTIGTLAVNDVAVLQIVATVTQSASITNTAGVSSDTPDLNPTNNSHSVTVSGLLADIQVVKVVDNASPNVGSNVSFTITVTNRGPGDASGIEILDRLPAGLSLVSATPDVGIYTSATGIWQLGSLANGASSSMAIVAQVTQASALVNTASVTRSVPADPTSSNNSSSAGLTGQQADLVLTKQASSTSASVGTNVSYSITLTNNGPGDATGVIIAEQWPVGLTFVSASASQGSFSSTTNLWDVGTVANGGSATLTIVAQVTQAIPITNIAQVSAADQPDPNSMPGNNSIIENDQAQVGIIGQPTAIYLSRFTASTVNNGVLLAWETSLEVNTWGFQVYRSATGERADAVLITDRLILARGRGQYTWLDQTAVPGQEYSYWLLEFETDGRHAEYGPASTARPAQDMKYSILLPLVVK